MERERSVVAPPIEDSSSVAEESRSSSRRGRTDPAFDVDPSIHFIVDPPRKPQKFQSWFALAIFMGVLLALAIVAMTT
jgi:hypothetical protein